MSASYPTPLTFTVTWVGSASTSMPCRKVIILVWPPGASTVHAPGNEQEPAPARPPHPEPVVREAAAFVAPFWPPPAFAPPRSRQSPALLCAGPVHRSPTPPRQ